MDTMYYNLSAKKVKASGGAELLTFIPEAVEALEASPKGEVLDFARCRQRLETRNAWKGLSAAAAGAGDVGEEEMGEDEAYLPRTRRSRGADLLESWATAALILVALSASWAFLHLL